MLVLIYFLFSFLVYDPAQMIQEIQNLAVDLTIYILWLKNFLSISTIILISVYYYHILNTNLEMSQPSLLFFP